MSNSRTPAPGEHVATIAGGAVSAAALVVTGFVAVHWPALATLLSGLHR